MKTIDLEAGPVDLASAVQFAGQEPVLILCEGREFMLSAVDDFEEEVQALRDSSRFQEFLDDRRRSPKRVSLAELEKRLAERAE